MQYPRRHHPFFSPKSNLRKVFSQRSGAYCALVLFTLGCATQPREHGKAADSLAKTTTVQAPVIASNTPATPPEPEANEGRTEAVSQEKRSEEGSLAPNRSATAKSTGERKRGSPKPAGAGLGAPSSKSGAAPAPAAAPASRPVFDDSEAQPAYAEPPELVRALAEFETQWEALSTSRACEDACRAFESMRRSAQKICDLVLDGDPKARCPTARARLEQASRDLSERCSTCR
jgi:hypothetical protein